MFEGVGVHTGQPAHLIVEPAPPGSGLVFIRTDLPGHPSVPVTPASVLPDLCQRCTILDSNGVQISTGEHLLSALMGLGIQDARLLLNGREVPFLDGSSHQFCTQLLSASRFASDQDPGAYQIRFSNPFLYESGTARFLVLPSEGFRVTYIYTSRQPLLRFQTATWDGRDYAKEIAPARTFGFLDELGPLLSAGLVKGASLNNSVVFGKRHLLNNGLRFPDEPARHKILDFLGDIAPLQGQLQGWVFCVRTGHRTNAEFVRALHEAIHDPNSGVTRIPSDQAPAATDSTTLG